MANHLSFRQWGKGEEVLVFLHYFGGAADSWQWMADILQSEYKCIALNLPGFGGTAPLSTPKIVGYTHAIRNILQLMNINHYTVIGHSMSGKIALQLAADYPSGIEQIILVAPSPPTQEPMPDEERERMLDHPNRKNAEINVKKATVKSLPKERYALAVDTQMLIDNHTWRWWLLEGMQHSIARYMPKVNIPVTVIASEDDPVIPYSIIQSDVVQLLKNATLVTVKKVGHLIPLEDPQGLADQIRQAIQSRKMMVR